ncbi:conserved hypothetical protein [Histoplasma capsulatum H143]|uniref:Uncharacterized protein n=1 Tax=Ajellomyces capsulatus (strain H143) TaxID=544712 RepID=C6HMA1_AJECH|nr:conserved hypothetical protein [Histoplasma capsulatum H143]
MPIAWIPESMTTLGTAVSSQLAGVFCHAGLSKCARTHTSTSSPFKWTEIVAITLRFSMRTPTLILDQLERMAGKPFSSSPEVSDITSDSDDTTGNNMFSNSNSDNGLDDSNLDTDDGAEQLLRTHKPPPPSPGQYLQEEAEANTYWACDQCHGKDGRKISGIGTVNSLETLWKQYSQVCKVDTSHPIDVLIIAQAQNVITFVADKKKLSQRERPKGIMYVDNLAEFTRMILATTTNMLFLIGQLKIQLILFCHLAGIVNRKPARSSAGTPLPTPSTLYDLGVLNSLNQRKVPLRNNLDDRFVFCQAVREGDAVHLVHELKPSSSSVSYEKQEETSRTGHKEGAFLCSAVKVLAEETKFGITATKRVLWSFEALSTQDDQLDSMFVQKVIRILGQIRIFVFRSHPADGRGFDPITPLARF